MANIPIIALFCFTIFVSSSLKFVYGAENMTYVVVGHVYCDTCRVEFETKLSEPISGAVVKLECRNRTNEAITFQSQEIVADGFGDYHITVEGDYEESDCNVALVRSPRADCSDPTEAWRKSRVVLTTFDGLSGKLRFVNNLGFKKDIALPQCTRILQEMGYYELSQEAGDFSPSSKL
ncbi:pollen allergen Che a 1-like isoform X1 [Gossypium australe]|uniref:Pollen allergen Che a 1-like isoform X1 n=1 Tax=Gossypium australe TaxID=47621 RepID=A0A5B6UH00_9ROSI|nr:pollen allergen Che a 1-like isoform X1 [Gossypium australe]